MVLNMKCLSLSTAAGECQQTLSHCAVAFLLHHPQVHTRLVVLRVVAIAVDLLATLCKHMHVILHTQHH